MIFKQKACEKLYKEGCYFFSLIYLAELELGHEIDAIAAYSEMISKGLLDEDCYVKDAGAIMRSLTGKRCSVRKSYDFSENLSNNERDITCYKREATEATYYHFVVMDKNGNVEYDPLEISNTVQGGEKHSRRIITIGG